MCVNQLWEVLYLAPKNCYLPEIAVQEGYVDRRHGTGAVILGVSASTWFHECPAISVTAGQNPVLKSNFSRLSWLSRSTVNVVFVFDGPFCPQFMQQRMGNGLPESVIDDFKQLIEAFGFKYYMAPGDAAAELAYLNKICAVDLIYTDNSNVFLFGATQVMRSPENPKEWDFIPVYTTERMLELQKPLWTQAGILFLEVMMGGDYLAGLDSCRLKVAKALASGPLPGILHHAVTNFSGRALCDALTDWRSKLHEELDNHRWEKYGYHNLGGNVPPEYPQAIDFNFYKNPVTTRSFSGHDPDISSWAVPSLPDIRKLAIICDRLFGWGPKILHHFRDHVWDGYFLRRLVQTSIQRIPKTTPLGPDEIRYVTSAKRNNSTPSIYAVFRVEIWLRSVSIEAFDAIQARLPSGTPAPGSASITSMQVWVPEPMLQCEVPQQFFPYLNEHSSEFSFGICTPYVPVLPYERNPMARSRIVNIHKRPGPEEDEGIFSDASTDGYISSLDNEY